jgi:hypothetical protein
MAGLNQTLGQPDLGPDETARVLHELTDLRTAKRSPLSPKPPDSY